VSARAGAESRELAPQTARLTTLGSGVRVVTEAMPSVRSIALGFWIRTGSRDEGDEQAGISHFLEHLLFKGTDRFSSREIDEAFDAMGAEVNAGTGKETTSVYSRFLDGHLERAFDVLQDMVLRPAYPDIDSERQVVIEEIAMYEDEPQDKVHDVLAGAIFGDHPLGRPIIGRAEVVSSVPVPEIAAWHDGRYVPKNVVVAAAGNVEHDAIVELVGSAFGEAPASPAGPTSPNGATPSVRFLKKDTEQYHLCLGGPGIPRGDERRFALRVLDTILGGSTSSRLFQEVREKRGLAYAVYSYASHYADTGQVALYVGTRPDNVAQAMDVIGAELRRLQEDGVSEEELERARENVKGRTVLSMESTLTRMNRLGSSLLMGVPLLTVDEVLAAFDAVTLEDVMTLAADLWRPEQMSAAGVGREEKTFRAALEPVSPALAAA
jgi:predicted Zn-dependent peptidase